MRIQCLSKTLIFIHLKMKFFLAAVVFVVVATTGSYALKCYQCKALNVETCRELSISCPGPLGRCRRAVGYTADGSLYGVLEACVEKSECDKPDEVCADAKKSYPEVATCKVSCCSEDNCNGSDGGGNITTTSDGGGTITTTSDGGGTITTTITGSDGATGDSSKTSQVMFRVLVFGVVTAMLLN